MDVVKLWFGLVSKVHTKRLKARCWISLVLVATFSLSYTLLCRLELVKNFSQRPCLSPVCRCTWLSVLGWQQRDIVWFAGLQWKLCLTVGTSGRRSLFTTAVSWQCDSVGVRHWMWANRRAFCPLDSLCGVRAQHSKSFFFFCFKYQSMHFCFIYFI